MTISPIMLVFTYVLDVLFGVVVGLAIADRIYMHRYIKHKLENLTVEIKDGE